MWAKRRRRRLAFLAWKQDHEDIKALKNNTKFMDDFVAKGRKARTFRAFKLYSEVAGSRMLMARTRKKIEIDVDAKIEAAKIKQEFLEGMIKELEEKYRIELRRKALIKDQLDKKYLAGANAI